MNENGIALLMGLALLASAAFGVGNMVGARRAHDETLAKACGTCDSRGDECGEFTCTAEGWR